MIIQNFDLNLIPDSAPVVVHCDQYDRGTGRLVISLYNGSLAYSPSGTAVIQGVKPDGKGFDYNCTLSGNTVTADLTEQMTAVAGQVRTQIVVTESTGRTGTFVFILDVQRSALPADTDMSESDYQLIEQAIEEAQGAVEDSEAWAVGERSGQPVPPTDDTYHNNAKYWAEQASQYAQGGLHYSGTCLFANIPVSGMTDGDMWNIEDDFITDSRFREGSGKSVAAGSNIAWIADINKWDVLAMVRVGSLDDLNDVNLSSPTNGQGLIYNSTTQEWENADIPSGGASALDDLTDVDIITPSSGQVLKYDGSKWVNSAGGSASGDYVGLYGDTLVGFDLNNITSVGNYYNDGTVTVTNYPSNPIITATSKFRLIVEKMGDSESTNLRQTYVFANSVEFIYIRQRVNGSWSSWQKLLTTYSNINELKNVDITSPTNDQVLTYNSYTQKWENKNAQGGGGDYMGLYGMTEIQSSDGQGTTRVDLNDYTTVGNYFCNGKALISFRYYQFVGNTSGYQEYSRTSAVFLLYVRKISDTYIIQTLYVNNSGVLVKFERTGNFNGTNWGFVNWSLPIKTGNNYSKAFKLNQDAFADVRITTYEENDILVFNDTAGTWENKPLSGYITNPNLLDNPWFTINQRGQSVYNETGSPIYTVDRWLLLNDNMSLTVNADKTITITNNNTGLVYGIEQKFEEPLEAGTYTFTIELGGNSTVNDFHSIRFYDASYQDIGGGGVGQLTGQVTFASSNCKHIFIYPTAGVSSLTVKAIKLEKGSISTLALDTAPNYATELLKCQRYCIALNPNKAQYNFVANGFGWSTTECDFVIPCPTFMRTAPIVVDVTNWRVTDGTNWLAPSSINIVRAGTTLKAYATVTGATQYRPYFIASDVAGDLLLISADL